MTAQDIIREIRTGVFTNAEITDMALAIQHARTQLGREVRRELSPGLTVYFRDRSGHRVTGTVESIKIKNAVVRTAGGRFRVPCNMLEV